MDLFLVFISQIFDAFVENSNLFLTILDILIKFLNLSLEFMLIMWFNIIYERPFTNGQEAKFCGAF